MFHATTRPVCGMDGHADTRHTPVLSIRTREPEKVRICHDTTADLEPPDQCLMSQNGGGTQTPDTRPSYLSGHKSQRKSGYATTRQLSSNQCLMSQNGGGMLHWTPTCAGVCEGRSGEKNGTT